MRYLSSICVIVFITLYSCTSHTPVSPANYTKPPTSQSDTAKIVTIDISQEGLLKTQIKSNYLVREMEGNNPEIIKFYGDVHVDFYNSVGEITNTVDAKEGVYNERIKTVILSHHVVVKNNKNESLFTEHLQWADSSHQFYTEDPVKVITTRQQINGVGLTAAEDFSKYQIHQLTGIITIDKSQMEK